MCLLVCVLCVVQGSSKVQEASLVKEKPAFRWRSKVETRCYSSTATEGDVTVKSGTEGEDGSAEDDVDLKKTLKGLKVRTVDSEMDDSMDYLSLETRGRRYQHDRGNKVSNLVCVCVCVCVVCVVFVVVCVCVWCVWCVCVWCVCVCVVFVVVCVCVRTRMRACTHGMCACTTVCMCVTMCV